MTEGNVNWMREEKSISEHPFLPLTGDVGEEVLRFTGPPKREVSNFTDNDGNPREEWRFVVEHYENGSDSEPITKIITESSDNFLAQVTKVTERGTKWNELIGIRWDKKKSRKGFKFKDFTFEKLQDPFA